MEPRSSTDRAGRRSPALDSRDDVDTDQIIPKQFLKRVERTGLRRVPLLRLGQGDPAGTCRRTRSSSPGATSAAAPRREHAPWALEDYGFRAIIAPCSPTSSTPTARRSGCCRSCCAEEEVQGDRRRRGEAEVDLAAQEVRFDGRTGRFEIDAEIKHRLLNGLDDIALTLQQDDAIDAYERERERAGPGRPRRYERDASSLLPGDGIGPEIIAAGHSSCCDAVGDFELRGAPLRRRRRSTPTARR